MKKWKALFTDSFHELKNLKTMAMGAMLTAIAVVLGFYSIQLTEYIRIGFAFLAKEMAGMLFGPVTGCLIGGLSDIAAYIVKPVGPYFPGFTISAVLGGLIYGAVLYKKPLSLKRIIVANGLVTVFVNLILNTYWMTLLYGSGFMAIFPARAVKQIITLPVEVVLFYAVSKIFARAHILAAARGTAGQ